MEKFIIQGNTRLTGEVTISGSKNAAVAIIPAATIINGKCKITNLPNISDVINYCKIIEELGGVVTWEDEHTVIIDSSTITSPTAITENVTKFRASYYLIGAFLARFGEANVGLPGGCKIGARPIDQHIKGFKALGASIKVDSSVVASAKSLVGRRIYLDVVSVGATINIMFAAIKAKGTTIIENAAKEPHIVDVAAFLNTIGANVKGAGTDTIKIVGVKELKTSVEYSVVPDQIETGTFMIAAAASKGDILIKNCIPKHMESLTAKLIEMGVNIDETGDTIRVYTNEKTKAANVKTLPYPGFPTDLQSQMGTLLSVSDGKSNLIETIWESRFGYTEELNKMGANIVAIGKKAVFKGVKNLNGAKVTATDLRAGAALIIAGIIADGVTELYNIEHIDRGYEHIEDKFNKLNAKIERASE